MRSEPPRVTVGGYYARSALTTEVGFYLRAVNMFGLPVAGRHAHDE
eukprot:SAG31_NODE_5031_length_2792_cov_2.309320_2_plen_46_part_00